MMLQTSLETARPAAKPVTHIVSMPGCCGIYWVYNLHCLSNTTFRAQMEDIVKAIKLKAMLLCAINNEQHPLYDPLLRESGFELISAGNNCQRHPYTAQEKWVRNNVFLYSLILNPPRVIPEAEQEKAAALYRSSSWVEDAPPDELQLAQVFNAIRTTV